MDQNERCLIGPRLYCLEQHLMAIAAVTLQLEQLENKERARDNMFAGPYSEHPLRPKHPSFDQNLSPRYGSIAAIAETCSAENQAPSEFLRTTKASRHSPTASCTPSTSISSIMRKTQVKTLSHRVSTQGRLGFEPPRAAAAATSVSAPIRVAF